MEVVARNLCVAAEVMPGVALLSTAETAVWPRPDGLRFNADPVYAIKGVVADAVVLRQEVL